MPVVTELCAPAWAEDRNTCLADVKKLFSTKCKQYTIKERKDIGTVV